MRKKQLPIGIDDFRDMVEGDYYFVDKSMLIDELLEKKAKVTLLPRPRRFGKTLNMSMLNYFFDIESKDKNRELFKNLAITETDKMIYQGEYPVIYLSLKDIKVNSWEECYNKIFNLMERLYKNYDIKLEKSRENLEDSLLVLSEILFKKYNKKVIILIDEYDTPLVTSHGNGYYREAISFFRNFYSAALKGNPNLEFSVLTGILRIAKESIFSGLNNLMVSTILDNEFQHFGLTEREVEKMLKDYQLEYELEEVKRWYNGYRFGNDKVYNPWSLINFARKDSLESYWVNTSDNALIKQILEKDDKKMREDLEALFGGDEIEEAVNDNIIFSDMDELDTIWSLMLFSGYLTYSKTSVSPITKIKTYSLKIPNFEVRSFFRNNFLKIYSFGAQG